MSLMADGGRIPAVGVFFNQKMANNPQIDNIMTAVTGLPLRVQFNIGEGLQWAGGAEPSLVAAPPSYEVCILSFGIEYRTKAHRRLEQIQKECIDHVIQLVYAFGPPEEIH